MSNQHVAEPFRMILNRFRQPVPEPLAFREAQQMSLPGGDFVRLTRSDAGIFLVGGPECVPAQRMPE